MFHSTAVDDVVTYQLDAAPAVVGEPLGSTARAGLASLLRFVRGAGVARALATVRLPVQERRTGFTVVQKSLALPAAPAAGCRSARDGDFTLAADPVAPALLGLPLGDVELVRDGAIVTIRRSKTDQEGEGRKVGIPRGKHPGTCPVQALTAWLERISGPGPIFRAVDRLGRVRPTRLSDRDVARVVKRAARAAGLDPKRYAGHSLRAGLATSVAAAGVEERAIMAQTGHRSVAVARRYIRNGSLFRGNAAAAVGL